MKHSTTLVICALICLCSSINLFAQTPQLINYQAVARNSETGGELANQSVFLSVKVLVGGPNGDISYQEEHTEITTNEFGLFNIFIGGGDPIIGSFDQIDWGADTHWLEIDLDMGNGLETVGSMQFVSVPYALHAETVNNTDDADADPTNELIDDVNFDGTTSTLNIVEAGQPYEVNLSGLINDADSDPANELPSDFSFNEETSELTLQEGGITNQVDLSSLINDADTNPSNEFITNFMYDSDENLLTITEGSGDNVNTFSASLADLAEDDDPDPTNELIQSVTLQGTTLQINEAETWSVSLEQLVDDADADPANELIDENGLNLTNAGILQITEGGITSEVDLTPLQEDGDWDKSADETIVYNNSTKVGIGTDDPESNFQVNGSVGYGISLIQSTGIALTYQISDADHVVVCKINTGTIQPITIDMPDPATCEGRVITVRRTGVIPLFADVIFNFNGADVDYVNQTIELDDVTQPQSITFLSLGADGWTEINMHE